MSEDATLGEIRLFAGPYAPAGWMLCEGQFLPANEYGGLAAVIGNTYGGTPGQTIQLPDLRGRVVIGAGQRLGAANYPLAQSGGKSTVQLTDTQLPAHSHALMGTTATASTAMLGNGAMIAQTAATVKPFNDANLANGTVGAFSPQAIGLTPPASQPHDNIMPSLGLNYIIAVEGIMPG